jgi:hypothetical protein
MEEDGIQIGDVVMMVEPGVYADKGLPKGFVTLVIGYSTGGPYPNIRVITNSGKRPDWGINQYRVVKVTDPVIITAMKEKDRYNIMCL